FQAEDGIRYFHVTGVQTCALPIYFLLQADTDQQDVTSEIQVRMGLSNSSNHLRTARINMIHAGAASRIAEMDAMKQNIAEAEKRERKSVVEERDEKTKQRGDV